MTVIFTMADFWIEILSTNVTLPTDAGATLSANMPLERAGTCVGYSNSGVAVSAINDATEAVGFIDLLNESGGAALALGLDITGCRFRIHKQAGSDTALVTVTIMAFMRKSSARV